MNVREYLRSKGRSWKEIKRPSGLQAITQCPKCGDDKTFAISLDTGAFQCLRKNNCGIQGSWYEFQKLFSDKPLPLDGDNNFYCKPNSKKYILPQVKSELVTDKLYNYFDARKIPKEIVKEFKIGIKNNAVMFPHFEEGELKFIKYRSLSEKKFWNENDCKPVLFNMDVCKGESVLRITEGHFDAMAAKVYDLKAVSVPNGVGDLSWIESCWDYIEQFQYIYLFFDNDDAGQDAIKNIASRLGTWRCYNVILPEKDLNDCLMKGVPSELIYHAEANAVEFNHYILKKAKDYREDVKELNKHKEKRFGQSSCIKGLSQILKGWREEEVTIIQGRNGSGKSTFVNQELLHFVANEKQGCIASLELTPRRYLNWLCIQHNKTSELTDETIDQAFDFFGNDLFVVNKTGEISKEELFDVFTFAARKYGMKYFIIDSLMRLKFDPRYEHNAQKNFISDCSDFAKMYECHIFIIAHPRKGEHGNKRPSKEDVSGSGDITNLADNVLAMWRPDNETIEKSLKQGEDISQAYLYVQKNREWGTEDLIELDFNENSKLFSQRWETKTEEKNNTNYFHD